MEHGKTIELFLVNGTADSLVEAELSNWSGKALRIPRNEVPSCKNETLSQPGVYFLFCKDDDNTDSVYIGEAENVKERLLQHLRNFENGNEKYYWTTAVVFTGRDLNKAHIRYLEHKLAKLAAENGRYKLITKNTYKNTVLKDSQIATMEEFIDNIKILINALGYKVLEPLVDNASTNSNKENKILSIETKETNAKGVVTNEGFVLLKGAKIKKEISKSLSSGVRKLREKYITEGKVVSETTTEDILFSSSSAAAAFVSGSSASGPVSWKDEDGVSLKELEARRLQEED